LSRKLRIKVATAVCTWHRTGCSVPQFSRQPLIPFEFRFVFPDWSDTHNRLQRPNPSRGANQRWRFSGCPSSCGHSKFLGNFRLSQQPLAPFELCFVSLDWFNTSKHLIESKILCRSFQGCKIWIRTRTSPALGGDPSQMTWYRRRTVLWEFHIHILILNAEPDWLKKDLMNRKRYRTILWKSLCSIEFRALTEPSILKNWQLATADIIFCVTMSRHNATAWICHNVTVCADTAGHFKFDSIYTQWKTCFFRTGGRPARSLCFFLVMHVTAARDARYCGLTSPPDCVFRYIWISRRNRFSRRNQFSLGNPFFRRLVTKRDRWIRTLLKSFDTGKSQRWPKSR